ncbi:MAG: Rpn family recombination-promoting nuclease/putative transposase [Bacteroidetes bacterium]|nr:Rpn family recombination-promoting nuclease/putative transposase [Bacteroidota bacterium]MBU1720107.1 Rpn family recombination-promoting nuclease/putative transposase [Bacteroidota bacterium]
MKYLDPKNDLTFKKVFGQHPHLLKSFLNALLPLPGGTQIESLEYLPAELVPEIPLMKHSIVDVRCKDNRGRQFIVEMQMHWTTGFMQRVLFNASKAYVKQLDKSYEYKALQPVYALSLINETYEPEKREYYHHYQIVNVADTEKQLEGLEFVFVELPKFKAQNIIEKRLQVLWLRFMTEIDEQVIDAPQELLESREIKEALENLHASGFNKAELETYDKYWDSVRTEKTLRSGYYDKGKTEGRAEGRAEGVVLSALRLLRQNMSTIQISEWLQLPQPTVEQVRNLLEKHGDQTEQHLDEIR